MEVCTGKLQDLDITSDMNGKTDDGAEVGTEPDHAVFERDYLGDDDEELEPEVMLGVLRKPKEPQHFHSLLPQHLPSKAGGAPAWLDPVNLPSGKSSCCDFCGDPLRFVMQETTYHRAFFVFMCPSMSCLQLDQREQGKDRAANARRSVKVFRCQLPRINAFYTPEEPKGCMGSQCSGAYRARLCDWCGTWKGEILCSHCSKASYCSRKHQELHWHASHENDCSQIPGSPDASILPVAAKGLFPGHAWPEYAADHVPEPSCSTSSIKDTSELMMVEGEVESDAMMQLFMDQFEDDEDNTCWASFRDRVSRQTQVLRYCAKEDAEPLWAVSTGSLTGDDIPLCIYCNGQLRYEFQLISQLLHYFHVENERDPVDWATIVVYTCRESCDESVSYKEEFVCVQFSPPTRRTYRSTP
ncbi:hypothetical protein CFC21_100508 [Triticum aestivum]|uniref:MYND-type domain-containing protein n=2 Tax=Triticum aestivum TaxID=4565 RepID=A0A3B6RSD6_WHEAT|nr:hypothetical protein CFC21_100508 [Triticum aestivum]